MDPNASVDIERQRRRRKRVKRIKTFIISFITIWILASITAITILTLKVISLQKQLNDISARLDGTTVTSENLSDGEYDGVALSNYAATAEDNLAQAGDTLKVYLTFDDGPSANSDRILDILDDYNVKATFFVNGREDEHSLAVYKRITDEGHTIAMHSYSHNYSELYSSLDAFSSDYQRIHDLIFNTTGVDCKLYRFPGGSSNQISNVNMAEYIQYLNENNIEYLDWNVASGDATTKAYTSDDLVENVMKDVVKYKASVVLLHDADNKNATVEALPKLIEQLQGVGALILPVSEDTDLIQHVSISN